MCDFFELSVLDKLVELGEKFSLAKLELTINNESVSLDFSILSHRKKTIPNQPLEKEKGIEKENFYEVMSDHIGVFKKLAKTIQHGDLLKKEEVLGHIQFIDSLFFEIRSPFDAVFHEFYIEDGDIVEYGQPLLKIKKNNKDLDKH